MLPLLLILGVSCHVRRSPCRGSCIVLDRGGSPAVEGSLELVVPALDWTSEVEYP